MLDGVLALSDRGSVHCSRKLTGSEFQTMASWLSIREACGAKLDVSDLVFGVEQVAPDVEILHRFEMA